MCRENPARWGARTRLRAGTPRNSAVFAQGGFGGGHGPLGYAIYLLTLPGGWILSSAYESLPGGLPDVVAIIWIPVMINILLAMS